MSSEIKKKIWLVLSAFGIMFAILSWIQESFQITIDYQYIKGFIALIIGIIVYHFFKKSL
tara:strand:- start:5075 stop:5254 length:180 start_codon:yes stop_codon:yes gene_type:complete